MSVFLVVETLFGIVMKFFALVSEIFLFLTGVCHLLNRKILFFYNLVIVKARIRTFKLFLFH